MKPTNVYVFTDESKSVIKVGITRNNVKDRLYTVNNEQDFYNFHLAFSREFSAKSARKCESKLLGVLRSMCDGVEESFAGSTECFTTMLGYSGLLLLVKQVIYDFVNEDDDDAYSKNNCSNYVLVVDSPLLSCVGVKNNTTSKIEMLALNDKAVYTFIEDVPECTQLQISEAFGISTKTVERSLQKLQSCGMLSVKKERIHKNVFAKNVYTPIQDFTLLYKES